MSERLAVLGGRWGRVRPWVAGVCAFALLILLVQWGGTARPGPLFVLGVAVLSGLILAFAVLVWWLYSSPMPGRVEESSGVGHVRIWVAGLAALSGLLFVSGGLWDEVWHRRFGGFGSDFLWPPHMLIYVSLALMTLFAGMGLFLAFRGAGSLRQRFRREPLIGLLGLVCAYLLASLPSDELWHRIYGRDLTAWSLPHVLIATGVSLVMLCAIPLALSGQPPARWRGLSGFGWREGLGLGLAAVATTMLLQLLTAEWESLRLIPQEQLNPYQAAFWARPEWLYPVIIVTVACFMGGLAQAVFRRVGIATLLGLLVLGLRVGLLELFSGREVLMGFVPHTLILIPLVALDAFAWWSRRQGREPGWTGNLWAAAALLLIGLPLISGWLVYPRVNDSTLPSMVFWSLLMALGAGWAGRSVGAWINERTTESARL